MILTDALQAEQEFYEWRCAGRGRPTVQRTAPSVACLIRQTVGMQRLHPQPQVVDVGGIIRWAVGDQDDPNWRRARTWNLVGSRNSDDVYLAPRHEMDRVKLSLHGTW